jgi:hypothetical protein
MNNYQNNNFGFDPQQQIRQMENSNIYDIRKLQSTLNVLNWIIILLLSITIITTISINMGTYLIAKDFYPEEIIDRYARFYINAQLNKSGLSVVMSISQLLRLGAIILGIVIWGMTLYLNSNIKRYNLLYSMHGYAPISKMSHSGIITFASLYLAWFIIYVVLYSQFMMRGLTASNLQMFMVVELIAVVILNGSSIFAYIADILKLKKQRNELSSPM